MGATEAIQLRQTSFRVDDGRFLLNEINLTFLQGTTTALLGRSGSGKTTLLRMVNRLLEPTSGDVLVEGQPTTEWDPIVLRRRIGYVIQETGLFPHFTIERNAGVALEIEGRGKEQTAERAHEMLALVGLDAAAIAKRYPYQLSGGQRQRVGLARALAADPGILLMDEPFGALDPLTRLEIQTMMRGLLDRMRKTVLMVTHDLDEALYLASRIVLLDTGRLIADVTPEEMLRSDQPEVRAYVRAYREHDPKNAVGGAERT